MMLDSAAQKLYDAVKAQAPIATAVDQQIATKVDAQGKVPLTAAQLESLLVAAMPAQSAVIQQASKSSLCHHADGKKGCFVSTIATLMIEKERNAVAAQPAIPQTPRRDPLIAEILIAKDADFVVVVNGGVFDASKKPLAMKIIARERANEKDLAKVLEQFHTTWGDKPDVVKIANDTAYHKLEDQQEHEFQFGTPVAIVSFNGKGDEIGRAGKTRPQNKLTVHNFLGKNQGGKIVPDLTRPHGAPSVQTGTQLDQTPVQTFPQAIELELEALPTFPKGGWLETPASHVKGNLKVGASYLLEPDSMATVGFLSAAANTKVAAEDFSFKGSAAAAAGVAMPSGLTLGQLLNQNVSQTARSAATTTDQRVVQTPAKEFIYRNAQHMQIGGAQFVPLQDKTVKNADFEAAKVKASIKPLEGDPECDGYKVALELAPGFVSSQKPASLAGWTIEVGYNAGPSGAWQHTDSRKIEADSGNGPEKFQVVVGNPTEAIALNRNIEVRLRNPSGVPAGRVLIPFKELKWAE